MGRAGLRLRDFDLLNRNAGRLGRCNRRGGPLRVSKVSTSAAAIAARIDVFA
jgi:hypothetical protein